MKFIFVLLAVLAAVNTITTSPVPEFGKGPLYDDLKELVELIPMDQITEIIKDYGVYDYEFQKLIYLMFEQSQPLLKEVEEIPEFIDFLNYLHYKGIYAYDIINDLNMLVGIDGIKPPSTPKPDTFDMYRNTNGLNGLMKEILQTLPFKDLLKLFLKKLQSSPDFANLIRYITTPKFRGMGPKLYACEHFKILMENCKKNEINMDGVKTFFKLIFGTTFADYDDIEAETYDRDFGKGPLYEELKEFIDLMPMKNISRIFIQYFIFDPEFQVFLHHLTVEGPGLMQEIFSIPEFVDYIQYLFKNGIDVYPYLNGISRLLGVAEIVPPKVDTFSQRPITGGLAGLVKDVKALIPVKKLWDLYKHKLATSEIFRQWLRRFQSAEVRSIGPKIYASAHFQKLLKELRDAGIDMKAAREILRFIFGLSTGSVIPGIEGNNKDKNEGKQEPSSSWDLGSGPLFEDLKAFIDVIPIDKISRLIVDYGIYDREFQIFLHYLTVEAPGLMKEIEQIPEFLNFANYLQSNGVYVYKFINSVNRLLGLVELKPPVSTYESNTITGGLAGMVKDVKSVIPIVKIAQIYVKKFRTSPVFVEFVKRLRSEEVRSIGPKISANKHFQNILQQVKKAGIDVEAAKTILKLIFGTPINLIAFYDSYSLEEDLKEFLDLVPLDKVHLIINDYINFDKEVQKAIEFIQSTRWHAMVLEIENLKEYQELVIYLHKAGLDIFRYIQSIHRIFGMGDYVPPVDPYDEIYTSFAAPKRGIVGMVADIKAVLPLDDIKALYHKKLETSENFVNFIAHLSSPEMQRIVNVLYQHETFQEALRRCRAVGLDVEAIGDLITTIFGIKFPKTQ